MKQWRMLAVLALAGSAGLAACEDNDVVTPGADEAPFAIKMEQESARTMGAALLSSQGVSALVLDLDVVESIRLPLGSVEAHLGAEGEGEWVVAGSIDDVVDLMALPEEGITVLDSSLPQGEYTALRFWLTDEATITLAEDVTVGRTTFEAGEHTLEIPSADEAGVRLHADFTVDTDGEALTVLFDREEDYIEHVTATGSGTLKIAPELWVENEDGEDVGDLDDDEGEDEAENEIEGYVASLTETGFVLEDGTEVRVTAETEIEGDLLSLTAVAEALANGEEVEAEVEGAMEGDILVASKVEFEVDDDDGDGDADDEDDGEVEVEGLITGVDRAAGTFTIEDDGTTITVVVTEETEIEDDEDYVTFAEMADAFDDGVSIEAEAEGEWESENRLLAHEVEFEVEDDDA